MCFRSLTTRRKCSTGTCKQPVSVGLLSALVSDRPQTRKMGLARSKGASMQSPELVMVMDLTESGAREACWVRVQTNEGEGAKLVQNSRHCEPPSSPEHFANFAKAANLALYGPAAALRVRAFKEGVQRCLLVLDTVEAVAGRAWPGSLAVPASADGSHSGGQGAFGAAEQPENGRK